MELRTPGRFRINPTWIVIGIVGVLTLLALGVPLGSLLFVGVLLLCPLLMAGMHGGHGGHDQHAGHRTDMDDGHEGEHTAHLTSRPPDGRSASNGDAP